MIYVFDTNTLSNVLNHYYPDRFPSFWEKFGQAIELGLVVSVRQVELELKEKFDTDEIARLTYYSAGFFAPPSEGEFRFVTTIYSVPHFRQNLERKTLIRGAAFADPFIIARANALSGIVVTEEKVTEHAAKIPNICSHFHIGCTSLEGYLLAQNWTF